MCKTLLTQRESVTLLGQRLLASATWQSVFGNGWPGALQHKGVVGGRVGAVHGVGAHRGRVLLLQQLLDNAAREGLRKNNEANRKRKKSKGCDT